MADLSIEFRRHQVAEPVLARLGAADRQGVQRRARLRGGLGRRRLEDARRGPADRQRQRPALRRHRTATDRRVIGFNNIELITDRPLEVNLREIKQVKRDWPDRALVVSLMVPCEERAGRRSCRASRTPAPTASSSTSAARTACPSAAWARRSARCPNTSRWSRAGARQHTRMPVHRQAHAEHHRHPRAGARGEGAAAPTRVSLINTINSIIGVDLDTHGAEPVASTARARMAAIAARR